MTLRSYNSIKAVDALAKAQFIAVSPFVFKAVAAMRDLGILSLMNKLPEGSALTKKNIAEKCHISQYAASVLVDVAVTADIMVKTPDGYILSKVGDYLADEVMTKVNFDFTDQVCYQGLSWLTESLKNGRPEGLKEFTDSCSTIYPFISKLPEPARKAWFAYDHFYSDHVFPTVLPMLFKLKKFAHIYDVGGNTGIFAEMAVNTDKDVAVTVVDLPEQCAITKQNAAADGLSGRIDTWPVNILDKNCELPEGGKDDLWWMSQFLDCFSGVQIFDILTRVRARMAPGSFLAVNEIFGDKQKNDIASLVIDSCTLYFTAMANGRSRFYHADDFLDIVNAAGFKLIDEKDHIGMGHSLLILTPKDF